MTDSSEAGMAVEGLVPVDYHQFLILASDDGPNPDEEPADPPNGLVEQRSGGLTICTGTQYGQVRLRAELRDSEPPLELGSWDEVVDVSVDADAGSLIIDSLLGEAFGEFPNLAFRGPATYRLRFCARGRDAGHEHTYDAEPPAPPVEEHAVLVWPAPPTPVQVHKVTDATGAALRGEPAEKPATEPGTEPDLDQAVIAVIERLAAYTAVLAPEPATETVNLRRQVLIAADTDTVFETVRYPHWWLGVGGAANYALNEAFSVYVRRHDLDGRGSVQAVEPGRHFAFTWQWLHHPSPVGFPQPATLVEINLTAQNEQTHVEVHHHDVPADWAADLRILWNYYLQRLSLRSTNQLPGRHPWDRRQPEAQGKTS